MKGLSKAINRSKQRPFYLMGGYGRTPEPEFFLKKSPADFPILYYACTKVFA